MKNIIIVKETIISFNEEKQTKRERIERLLPYFLDGKITIEEYKRLVGNYTIKEVNNIYEGI